ncbi:hypothetical protein GCM10009839_40310 [Catenulispora yoronensis]|uniref:Uncharacterized protein n=1 Tax=Catenulispora yoronensis TaxID=450799 RepID=A0ABP5FW90_9ACTN
MSQTAVTGSWTIAVRRTISSCSFQTIGTALASTMRRIAGIGRLGTRGIWHVIATNSNDLGSGHTFDLRRYY